eukprot:5323221-Karenia_brevis.AAC.1
MMNGDREDKVEEWEEELLGKPEAKEFTGLAARLNFMSHCPNLQVAIKQCSRDMSNPKIVSWRALKKIARYLVGVERVVWKYYWQEDGKVSSTCSDSDRDRKSTSGGVFMIGNHSIKTWSSTQGASALSSAEAELYAMVDAVTRAKGL